MDAARKQTPLPTTAAVTTVAETITPSEVSPGLAVLHGLTAQKLRDEWRRLHRGQPPRISRDLLIRTIAYRMQELAYGGLSKATQRKLAVLSRELTLKGSVNVTPDVSLRPGARLVREWRGRTHTVVVTENGFEYVGKAFPSLTRIAHAITGAHWSGPRFFGLTHNCTSAAGTLTDEEAPHG
jgi:hypothetical protein